MFGGNADLDVANDEVGRNEDADLFDLHDLVTVGRLRLEPRTDRPSGHPQPNANVGRIDRRELERAADHLDGLRCNGDQVTYRF